MTGAFSVPFSFPVPRSLFPRFLIISTDAEAISSTWRSCSFYQVASRGRKNRENKVIKITRELPGGDNQTVKGSNFIPCQQFYCVNYFVRGHEKCCAADWAWDKTKLSTKPMARRRPESNGRIVNGPSVRPGVPRFDLDPFIVKFSSLLDCYAPGFCKAVH